MVCLKRRKLACAAGGISIMGLLVGALLSCSSASVARGKDTDGLVAAGHVYVLPVLTGGVAGWCITTQPGAACPVTFVYNHAIVAENWVAQDHPMRFEGFALTRSDVASVVVDGSRPIATRADASLPSGLREVRVEMQGWPGPKMMVPALLPGRKPKEAPRALPRFIALDRAGRSIGPRRGLGSAVVVAAQGRRWTPPEAEPRGICHLDVTPGSEKLVERGGFVATRVPPITQALGEPLLSCISNSFTVDGSAVIGAVLIDAHRPGQRPSTLPEAKPLGAGVFEALGASGWMAARRIPTGGWLVVSGGKDRAQRVAVLRHLRAEVEM
jgi:hypothetical protein